MGKSIVLVITPSPYLTKKIQNALDDMGGFQVITSSSPALALEITRKSSINFCILDMFHQEFPVLTVVNELRNNQPELRIILILSDPDFINKDISQIVPDGLLPRSFSFEQFKAILGSLYEENKEVFPSSFHQVQNTSDNHAEKITPLSTQQLQSNFSQSLDISILQQRLTNITTGQNAQEIILVRRKQLLSYKGKLPYVAVQEIIEEINSFSRTSPQNLEKEIIPGYKKNTNGNLIRFIQSKSIQSRHLLYVISLTKELLLSVVFEPDSQFSEIRRYANQIAHELLEPTQVAPLEFRSTYPQVIDPASIKSIPPTLQASEIQAEPIFESINNLSISPGKPQLAGEEKNESLSPSGIKQSETDTPEMKIKIPEDNHGIKNGYHESNELEDHFVGKPLDFKHPGKDTEIVPGVGTRASSSISSFGNYITYSCLLIPRMPQHLLTSNLAAFLFKWTGQLCLAYGWRLEHLSIHPNHIQMITGAPLTTSPALLVKTIRQKTSQHIFTQFPPLTSENPSGDFWAPGFFITGGKQTIQSHLVDQYVNEIRENQGVML